MADDVKPLETKTPKDVIHAAKERGAKIVDLRFVDVPGLWQHFSIPTHDLDEELFAEGIGFYGSSIRGSQTIDESDMLLMPDPTTAQMDPFAAVPTIVLNCNVKDPVTMEAYTRDPRYVAQKAELFLKQTGIADTVYIGPELEFFILDSVKFDQGYNYGFYQLDSEAGFWNAGKDTALGGGPNLGYKPRYKQGYFPVPPMDHFQDIRSEMVLNLESVGVKVEVHHHEVATAGQTEIDIRFNTLTTMADRVMWYKYVTKNTARKHGKTATFMPKPIFQDNGSGMHTHQSLWRNGKPLFAGDGYAGLSQMALHYLGGLIAHGPALSALIAPTTNSYKRLVPGFEAPVNLAYSRRNRSAACRIPMYSASPKAKRVEFRPPDPSCNPYLAFSAMMM